MTAPPATPSGWCPVDDCPSFICNGPHWEVVTTMGIEVLRWDQVPIGQRIEPPDYPPSK